MKLKKLLARTTTLSLVMAIFCSMTAAAYYESPIPNYYDGAYGKRYKVTSILYEDSSTKFRGSVWAQTTNSSNVPADTIGCQAMLCDGEDGEAFFTGRWSYNPSSNYFHNVVTPAQYWTRSVFAKGLVDVGTGRDEPAPPSPTRGSARSISALMDTLTEDGAYPVNKQGETFGSLILSDVTHEIPDLISAKNASGISGYIRHDDLRPASTTPEGLAAYYAVLETDSTIPLYDLNGNVIGAYEIGKNEEMDLDMTDIEEAKKAVEAAVNGSGIDEGHIKEAKATYESPTKAASTNVTTDAAVVSSRIAQKSLVNGQYPVTVDGRTYGPIGIIPHVHPDLVAVIATNGKSGYAELEEYDPYLVLLSNPNTPREELLAARERLDDWAETLIPVYDLDGNVIGEYVRYAHYAVEQ